ncbi:MAG: hypothetical protein H7222_00970 [Methylotenera sp.]|nr:hypothetical protein [Oligoflexia bacterium]
MSERRTYSADLVIDGRPIHEIVIDPHYEAKHEDIDDVLILELVGGLDGREFQAESRDGEWEFFMLDRIDFQSKQYRLIWCLRDDCLFI